MRGEDSSQTGIAITSEGETSENIDPAAVEADLEHVEEVLEEKYRASETCQNEPPSRQPSRYFISPDPRFSIGGAKLGLHRLRGLKPDR